MGRAGARCLAGPASGLAWAGTKKRLVMCLLLKEINVASRTVTRVMANPHSLPRFCLACDDVPRFVHVWCLRPLALGCPFEVAAQPEDDAGLAREDSAARKQRAVGRWRAARPQFR